MKHLPSRSVGVLVAGALLSTALAACSSSEGSGASTENGVTTLELWTHNGGNVDELAINQQVVDDFNASQSDYKVKLQSFPQDAYNQAIVAAAAAKKLPCVLDVDGPNMPNWAWAGYLEPLDLPASVTEGQLPSTLGTLNDTLYSVGNYDVSLNLMTRRSTLDKYDIRVPTMERPWTATEFNEALAKLKAGGEWKYPFDLGTAGGGEWIPYAYSPILQSFGGDLINRDTNTSADDALNGPAALSWAHWFQDLISQGYVAKKSGADSTLDFINGKSAIVWSGSWASAQVSAKFDDVLFLPPVDFGNGPKIGGASWQWAESSDCAAKDGASAFLAFSLQDKYRALYSEKLGLIPASESAAALTKDYAPDGKYRFFYDYAQKYAVQRPVTPAYPFISSVFQKAYADIIAGGDAQEVLDKAVEDIDNNIKQNGDYAF